MIFHEFTTILADLTEIDDEIASRLYASGCDDGLVGSRAGVAYINFDREAESLEAAIMSAIQDVQKAGYRVQRVEIDVATRINAQLQTA